MDASDITAEMTIEDMIEKYPQASGFFLRYGIKCFTCSGIIWGTIGETLRRKNVDDVEGVVEELRSYVLDHQDEAGEKAEICEI